MAEGILTTVATKIIEKAGTSVLKKVASWWGAEDDLKKLERGLRMIRAWVADAEKSFGAKQSAVTKEKFGRLRDVLLRADDLFDDVLYFDRRKQEIKGNKLTKEVKIFVSPNLGPFSLNRKLAHEIKSIRQELDDIKSDIDGLESFVMPVGETSLWMSKLMENRETMSFVQPDTVIGRDEDKETIVEIVLNPVYAEKKLTVLPIVGFGGIGKTTIAQLIFNDDRINNHFDCMKWTCVPVINNMKEVMRIIYRSFTNIDSKDRLLEDLQNGIRDFVENQKFLLILDDVWEESREKWLPVLKLLECGRQGSMIIVTSRSDDVAKAIGTVSAYPLQNLSPEESWKLFVAMAFRPGQEESNPNFTEIGRDIVDKCGNVPLAIRAIGSLLFTKDSEQEWLLIRDSDLLESELLDGSSIMPVLQLSYEFLPSPLKKCFAYCSLFEKDYVFDIAELVRLWMAQGYIAPSNVNLNLEDVGDLYFQELLRKNFFQITYRNDGTTGTKMHDIMHDLACHVATDALECGLLSSQDYSSFPETTRRVRTILFINNDASSFFINDDASSTSSMISRFPSLRVLGLMNDKIDCLETLPDSFKKLRHLRYLSLPGSLQKLPDFISKLDNLLTLKLNSCWRLTELPRGLTKLTNLRHLGIKHCHLTDLPPGFENMKSLQELDKFIVGGSNGLDALAEMNLKGNLLINICSFRENGVSEANKSNLKVRQLDEVKLLIINRPDNVVLARGCLKFIPQLVSITVDNCRTCQQLPEFHQLPHLKYLHLKRLVILEYIEDDVSVAGRDSSCCGTYFPSLLELELNDLPELKEWSRVERGLFPCLFSVTIKDCRKLTSMPQMPRLQNMWISRMAEAKVVRAIVETHRDSQTHQAEIWSIENIHSSSSWSIDVPPNLECLAISYCQQLTSLHVSRPNWFLRKLSIEDCSGLRKIWNGLQHLAVLERLHIQGCEELDLWDLDYEPLAASNNLCHLEVYNNSKLQAIPYGICSFFTALQGIQVLHCPKLESLPESFANLTSLQLLEIYDSPLLEPRCRQPDGEYWPLIQHIPQLRGDSLPEPACGVTLHPQDSDIDSFSDIGSTLGSASDTDLDYSRW